MAKRNLAEDLSAYSQKVSSGQNQEATTKYNTKTQQSKGSNYTRTAGQKTYYANPNPEKSSSSKTQRRSNQEYRRKKEKEEEEERQKSKFSNEANAKKPADREPEQRNFLAEAAESTNKPQVNTTFTDEAQDGIGQYGAGNIDLYDRDTKLFDQDGNLMTVRSMSFNEDGKETLIPTVVKKDGKWTQLSDEEAIDWYHKTGEYLGKFNSVDEANEYAQRLHEQQEDRYVDLWANMEANQKPKENRDELVRQYQAAVEHERNIAGYATDPFAAAYADEARATREDLEKRLKDLNAAEGKSIYTDLADEAKARDRIEGFQGERESQYGAGLGIIADWLGEKTGNESLEKWGEGARESGRTAAAEAAADWENSLEGKSGFAKTAAGVAKSAGNVAEDMAVNFLTLGFGGKVLMALRAAGSGAMTQEGREKNDTDSVMAEAMLNAGSALLSNKLLGAFEGAYGKSILGPKFSGMFTNLITNPTLRKAVTNTEGFEEGLEFGINYIGDRLLGLDGESRNPVIMDNGVPKFNPDFWKDWSWGEFSQNVIIGYFLGTIFNGIQGGQVYDANRIKAVADEAIEAAQSGLTFDEIANVAMDTTSDQVVIKPGAHEAVEGVETETQPTAEIAPAESAPAETPVQNPVNQILQNPQGENGQLSNSQVRTILENPDLYADFLEATGLQDSDIDHSSKSNERNSIKDAAQNLWQRQADQEVTDIVNEWNEQQGAEVETPTTPNADTRARLGQILDNASAEGRGLAPSEIQQILADPAMLQAYADENGTTTRQARQDLENRLNGAPDETGSIANNDQYQNSDNAWDRFWGAANQGPDALIRLIASDPDNMAEYMKYYEQATGEQMSSDPDVLLRQLTDLARDSGGTTPVENQPINNSNPEPVQANTNQQGQQEQNTNQNQNAPTGQPINNDTSAPGNGKEKVSEFYLNTLANREGTNVRHWLTYLTKTEAQTLQNAMTRLNMNGQAEMATMMASTMWSDEQVKMGKVIGQNLLNDARKTGNWDAYDSWRKIEREHATAIARALRAYGRDPEADMTAEGIAKMAANYLAMLKDDVRAAQESGRKSTQNIDVDLETIDAAQKAVTEATNALGNIEAEETSLREQGYSEDQIWERTKDSYLDIAQDIIARQYGGFLLDDVTGKNADVRDGVQDATTMLRNLLATESPEYIRNYTKAVIGGIATDVRYMGHTTMAQRAQQVSSIQKMCQLFGLGTIKRNLIGNTTFGVFDWASNNTAGWVVDGFLSLLTGERTRGLETGVLGAKNYKNGFEAARRSALEIAANLDMQGDGKYISGTSAFSKYDIGGRFAAKTNQLLSYALNTTDAAFVGFNEQSASDAALRANRGGAMTEETAQKIGENEAKYRTFKNTTGTQKILEAVRAGFDLIGWGGEITHFQGTNIPSGRKNGFGLGTAIVPYIGVPVNLGLKVAEYSPIGAAKGLWDASQAVKGARNAGTNQQAMQDALVMQNQASGEIGRGIFGTGVVLMLKALMKQAKDEGKEWFKDWNLEKNSAIKAQNKAEGKSGQQVNRSMLLRILNGEPAGEWKNDDELVNMSPVEPLNQTLALASLLADDEHSSGIGDYLKALGTATLDSLEDLPAISSLTQISDTFNYNKVYDTAYEEDANGEVVENREVNWGKTGGNALLATLGNAASGFIPAPLRHVAQVQDEYQRDTRGNNAAETAWNQVVNSTPTVKVGDKTIIKGRQSLPIKTDAFGNPISNGDKETRTKNAYGALKYTKVNHTPVSKEINRLYQETGDSIMPSASGPKTITFGSGKNKRTVELSADESRKIKDEKGKDFEKRFKDLMWDPKVYNPVGEDVHVAMGKELQKMENDAVKADIAKKNGIEYESKYEDVRALDDPTKYLGLRTGFTAENKENNFDSVDALVKAAGDLSQKDRDYLREHTNEFGKLWDMQKAGVGSKEVDWYDTNLKERTNAAGKQNANGYDIFQTVVDGVKSGNLTEKDADAFMNRKKSDGSYYAAKGRHSVYQGMRDSGYDPATALEYWDKIDANHDGTLSKKEFDNALKKYKFAGESQFKDYVYRENSWGKYKKKKKK